MFDFFKNVIIYGGIPGILIVLYYLYTKIFITKDIISKLSEKNILTVILVFVALFSTLTFLILNKGERNNNEKICKKIQAKISDKIVSIDSCLIKINMNLGKIKKSDVKRVKIEADSELLLICREKFKTYLSHACDSLLPYSISINLNECDEILTSY